MISVSGGREHTIRGVPLSRCALEVLVKERDDARRYFETHQPTDAQKQRQFALEREIRRRA